jgi:hypothetical protein
MELMMVVFPVPDWPRKYHDFGSASTLNRFYLLVSQRAWKVFPELEIKDLEP